jgi:hypothetical protein
MKRYLLIIPALTFAVGCASNSTNDQARYDERHSSQRTVDQSLGAGTPRDTRFTPEYAPAGAAGDTTETGRGQGINQPGTYVPGDPVSGSPK